MTIKFEAVHEGTSRVYCEITWSSWKWFRKGDKKGDKPPWLHWSYSGAYSMSDISRSVPKHLQPITKILLGFQEPTVLQRKILEVYSED